MTGIIAGSGTLLTCWVLLIVGVATWRRLLWNRDLDGWAQEWARVEPSWSNRTGVED